MPPLRSACLARIGVCLAGLLVAAPTLAQVEQVDPDVEPSTPIEEEVEAASADEAPPREEAAPPRPAAAAPSAGAPTAPQPPPTAAPLQEPKRIELRPLPPIQATEADLEAAWARWRKAHQAKKPPAKEAWADLVRIKSELGVGALDAYAMALVRASRGQEQAGDAAGAVELATAAVELAPTLPQAHFGLARAYFSTDVSEVGRYLGAVQRGVALTVRDPRYLRPVLGDLGAALLLACVATAVVALAALALRRARYFLHDFHHLFPRLVATWQSTAVAVLLLAALVLSGAGVATVLLAVLAAIILYLSAPERAVAGALIALLGLLPLAGGWIVQRTAFAGTSAEDVYLLERGGTGAREAGARVASRVAQDRAQFGELYALGRHELRRGRLDEAIELLKRAIAIRVGDARAMTNLGHAMFAKGDLEGARVVYESAAQAAPSLAAIHHALAKLHERRAQAAPPDQAPLELDRARGELQIARELDPALVERKDPPADQAQLNRLLISPPLLSEDLAGLINAEDRAHKVRDQLSALLVGTAYSPLSALTPALIAALLGILGSASRAVRASRACGRCGRPVCQRCDPDLRAGGDLCQQCLNVFVNRGVVPAQLKVQKQIEVARYQGRRDKLSYALGLICSGAGHLFAGLPIRGALYAFCFLYLASLFLMGRGLLRTTYGDVPLILRLLPLGILQVGVYALSLRGLYKRQSQ